MTDISLSPEAVEVQAPPIERFRKRAIEVEMMLWDGTLERLVAIQQWIGPASDDPEAGPGFAGMVGPYAAELWVEHLQSWVSVPVGTRVAKEADGNGFYPISPAAIAGTFIPAPEPLELTPEERAAKEKHPHMSTCHDQDCQECVREIAANRRTIKAVRPVIEADARADERRKVYPGVVQRLLDTAAWHAPVGLADPAEISATDLAIAEAFRSEAKAWQKAADDGSEEIEHG